MSWGIEQITGSAPRKAVLLLLCDLADEQYTCYPGREYLAVRAELSDTTVSKIVTQLAKAGFIRVLRRARRRGGRTSNRYLIMVHGDATPLPDVDDWAGEFVPDDDETAGQPNSAEEALLPDGPEETAGQPNSAAGAPLPDPSNSAGGAHSTVLDEHSSNKEKIYPLELNQDLNSAAERSTHQPPPTGSAAAAILRKVWTEDARTVLRKVTVGVEAVRMPTGPERGRLVERVVALMDLGWTDRALVDRISGMGPLDTVASVYAVLTARLRNVGDPPARSAPGDPVGGRALWWVAQHPALPWCGADGCDRTTRRLVDADDRPLFTLVDGERRPSWCPDCSGR